MRLEIKQLAMWLSMVFALSSCLDMKHEGTGNDIPTKGEVTMHFDRSDSFVIEQLIHQFELEYPQAKIIPKYFSHQELLDLLNKGEIKGVFLHRSFTNSDKSVLERQKVKVRSVMVYKSSAALIANRDLESSIKLSDFLLWLTGENTLPQESLALYGRGGRFLELADSIAKRSSKAIKRKIISCNSPKMVIEQVQANKSTLGIVGVNWISDDGDSLSISLRKHVRILGFLDEINRNAMKSNSIGTNSNLLTYPFQSQIADNSYPFIEPVWGYDLQGYSGLVSGFLAFVCSHPGQVLIKKSGLYPALPPHRTIEIQ